MTLYIEVILYVVLGLLGVGMFRSFVRRYISDVPNGYLDAICIALVFVAAFLTIPKALSERELRDKLADTRDQLAQKDALRHWAMMFPTGEMARDANSLAKVPAGKRGDDFRKVFEIQKSGKPGFGGTKCHTESYMADINSLIEKYEESPYPLVALAFCLKNRKDPSWKNVAERAKGKLEVFLNIEPRVLTIDLFYASLIEHMIEDNVALEDTGFFVKNPDGSYRSKNAPPP